jgi:hypothetical protein
MDFPDFHNRAVNNSDELCLGFTILLTLLTFIIEQVTAADKNGKAISVRCVLNLLALLAQKYKY